MTPELEAVRALTEELYMAAGPLIGVHSPCREAALIALGIAAARGIEARLAYEPAYVERGHQDQHFWLEFEDGTRLDRWNHKVRLLPAPARTVHRVAATSRAIKA